MITISQSGKQRETSGGKKTLLELRGLSTDTKPTTILNTAIDNGSIFIEIDIGKVFMYDLENQLWKEI